MFELDVEFFFLVKTVLINKKRCGDRKKIGIFGLYFYGNMISDFLYYWNLFIFVVFTHHMFKIYGIKQ